VVGCCEQGDVQHDFIRIQDMSRISEKLLSSEEEEICLWKCGSSLVSVLRSQFAYRVGHNVRHTIMDVRGFCRDDGQNSQSAHLPEQSEPVSQGAYSTLQISLQCFILLPPGNVAAQKLCNLKVKRNGRRARIFA
jgi:hypothetical protein